MRNEQLIDRDTVYKFVTLIHERAAAAIAGMGDPRRPCLHLCSAAPDDTRFFHSAYNIGDIERMAADALTDSAAGKNVFIEPRLIRPGMPHERGRLEATLAVYAAVADGDTDVGKVFTAPVPASAVVQTSQTNEHFWYFLGRAIGATDAQELGRLMRQSGGDACSGNCVQPFRCAGTVNYVSRKKAARGRVTVPTSIKCITDKTYTADELRAHFSATMPTPTTKAMVVAPTMAGHSPAYSRAMAKAVLAAEPGADRSASFMSAASHAVRGGLTADQFETLARQHLKNGCASKYAGRLRQEIDRAYSKIIPGYGMAHTNEPQRRLAWWQCLVADLELGAHALRFADLVVHSGDDDKYARVSLQQAASKFGAAKSAMQAGRDQLIERKWLFRVADGTAHSAPTCYGFGRGPREQKR